jgi:hypothetical protein
MLIETSGRQVRPGKRTVTSVKKGTRIMKKTIGVIAACSIVLTALILAGFAYSGPAELADQSAHENLSKLKGSLPSILAHWDREERWFPGSQVQNLVIRRMSPLEARITIAFHFVDGGRGSPEREHKEIITIYLRFFDGMWTTTHYEATWGVSEHQNRAFRFLMVAIDQSAEN